MLRFEQGEIGEPIDLTHIETAASNMLNILHYLGLEAIDVYEQLQFELWAVAHDALSRKPIRALGVQAGSCLGRSEDSTFFEPNALLGQTVPFVGVFQTVEVVLAPDLAQVLSGNETTRGGELSPALVFEAVDPRDLPPYVSDTYGGESGSMYKSLAVPLNGMPIRIEPIAMAA